MTIIPLAPLLEHYGVQFNAARAGWQKIKCPVHDERVPSCSLNLTTNYLECHACGFEGHSLDLVMAKEGIATREAAREFCEGVLDGRGIAIPRGSENAGWRSGGRAAAGQGYRPRVARGWRGR